MTAFLVGVAALVLGFMAGTMYQENILMQRFVKNVTKYGTPEFQKDFEAFILEELRRTSEAKKGTEN